MSAPPLVVSGLVKTFGEFVAVGTDGGVSFTAQPGEVLGLLGPNGAGKTTIMHMLLGLVTPDAGSIRILGMDMPARRRAIHARVNFSSAYVSMPGNLTVAENLDVFARLYSVPERRRTIDTLVERLSAGDYLHKLTGSLSSGQLTRVNLVKALLNDPEVLFLDEPTASLDPHSAHDVRDLLAELTAERGLTIIYTSHNMAEVEAVCHRVLFLRHGQIIARGTPAKLIAEARTDTLEELFLRVALHPEEAE